MKRFIMAAALAAALSISMPVAASSGRATVYHTISYVSAYAEMGMTNGCLSTTLWINSVDGQWAGQGARVNKQRTTDVTIQVRDLCQPDLGKGHPVVYFASGTGSFGPSVAPRLSSAAVAGRVWVTDDDGVTVPVDLDLSWTPTSTLIRDRTNHHGLEPLWESHPRNVHFGVINTFDHSWTRWAEAVGSVVVDGRTMAFSSAAQTQLQSYRWRCQEVVFPHYGGETTWCFGF
jgi:hypothetical protein